MKKEAGEGLRERKKQQTRMALSDAAMQLAMQRGVQQVRIEDIAALANVSVRTFNNYFPSKEAAIVAAVDRRLADIRSSFAERPKEEVLEVSLRHAILSSFPKEPDRDWVAQVMLIRDHPSLAQELYYSDQEVVHELSGMIAESKSGRTSDDIFPVLLASTFFTAVKVATEHWLEHSGGRPLRDAISDALKRVHISDSA